MDRRSRGRTPWQAAELDEFQTERLEASDYAGQLRAIGDRPDEHSLHDLRFRLQRFERREQLGG